MMPIIEVGKQYSFKTLTFYYIGTVTDFYPSHAKISDAIEVFETGSNEDYYKGKIKNYEPIPDGSFIPLTGGVIIMPYAAKVQPKNNS